MDNKSGKLPKHMYNLFTKIFVILKCGTEPIKHNPEDDEKMNYAKNGQG